MLKITRRHGVAVLLILLMGLPLGTGCTAVQRDVIVITATPQTPVAALPPGMLGPYDFPANTNPLTGLAVQNPAVLKRRPLAVKISNAPDLVRPQAGIGAADLVFEHYVEGNLTRFTAIFWTNTPPRVGSVRSARLLDLEIPAMYGALFAYSGASEPIRQRIAALPFAPRAYEGVSVGAPLYYRSESIDVPHNLFVVPAEVWKRATADKLNQPPQLGGMSFSARPPANGTPAGRITLDYGPDVVRWVYDSRTGRYLRITDGKPHTDANTSQQVSASNVVLIYAHHQPDLSIVESEWQGQKSFSIEIQIWTLGPAVIFRDGQRFDGFWMRWKEDHMLSFWIDEEMSQRIPLKPGNTWFEIVPLDFSAVVVG